jgi:hypothetical protein
MIVQITNSPIAHKRYRVKMDNGKTYDFGLDTGKTYIDHHNKTIRKNYWLRHLGNPTERKLIQNLVPSPSLFSAMLLWGSKPSLKENARLLNNMWAMKHLL